MAITYHSNLPATREEPATNGTAITPADGTTLTTIPRALYIGGAGDVAVLMANDGTDTPLTFSNLPAGTVLPARVKEVRATGTTATNIVALW